MKLKEIKPGMVIHCKTEQEANELFSVLKSMDITWNIGIPLRETHFSASKGNGMGYYLNKHGRLEGINIEYYEESEMEITPFSSLIIKEKTYEDGLNEAWAAANKLADMMGDTLNAVFGFDDAEIIRQGTTPFGKAMSLTPQEAIAKLEAYEAEKRIKVGDVVKHTDTEFAVTCIGGGCIRGIDKLGETHCYTYPNPFIKKTGKHIDISSILAEIGKE